MSTPKMTWEEAVVWLRNQKDQADLVRSCYFDAPLLAAAERYYHDPEWPAIRNLLPKPPGRALDVGAGMGISSYALARDGWQVDALEPDPSEIVGGGAIRKLFADAKLSVTVAETWGESLPFADASFDVVHCRQTLHHARDLPTLGRELGRVLKRGGTLIATREHVLRRKEDLPAFLESHALHKFYGGENAYLLDEYLSALRGGHIRLVSVLNSLASDINLFPQTRMDIKKRVARKLKFPFPALIPDAALNLLGNIVKTPGQLYSFVGIKE